MEKNYPEFRRTDKFINGKLCETFFINNKEVDANTYYTLLEDRIVQSPVENFAIHETINSNKNSTLKTDVESQNNFQFGEQVEQKHIDYIVNIINHVREMDMPDAIELLLEEMSLQYKLGNYHGQIELTKSYASSMKKNIRVLNDSLEDMLDEYGYSE